MRILFASNMFPPYARGGYEQWCEDVALALSARGHSLVILTSRPSAAPTTGGGHAANVELEHSIAVYRLLHTQVEGTLVQTALRLLREPKRFEEENLAEVRHV